MTTTLITGAITGLGKETARQLVTAGHTVYVGARDEARGRAAPGEVGARFVTMEIELPELLAEAWPPRGPELPLGPEADDRGDAGGAWGHGRPGRAARR